MRLEEYFKDAKAYVWSERFEIVKAKRPHPDAFANIVDKDEITVIAEEGSISYADALAVERGWKILTLDIVFPMDVVGVTAKIAAALADARVSIMPIAAFSRDHFLVKENELESAVAALKKIGISVMER